MDRFLRLSVTGETVAHTTDSTAFVDRTRYCVNACASVCSAERSAATVSLQKRLGRDVPGRAYAAQEIRLEVNRCLFTSVNTRNRYATPVLRFGIATLRFM